MLKLKIVLVLTVISAVVSQSDYRRMKRGKYYSYPSRFYSRPPAPYPVKGIFSHTPPPFVEDEREPPYPGRPYKVSASNRRPVTPITDGLGDDDINNIMKHLSKEDLNRLIEFASEKDRNNYSPASAKILNEKNSVYKGNVDTQDEKQFEMDFKEINQYLNYATEATDTNIYNTPPPPINNPQNYQYSPQPINNPQSYKYSPQPPSNSQIYQHSSKPLSNPQNYEYSAQPLSNTSGDQYSPPSEDSYKEEYVTEINEEEKLPLPDNMRTDDFDVSYTNNVPTIVKAGSYKVENFGDLPLMDYSNSKLHSVSSYHVPHYTITHSNAPPAPAPVSSSSSLLKPSPGSAHIPPPLYEAAPPITAAKDQSDAHLKATKIWSHKSRGAAYTLHDDGTLTPELPGRPKNG